MKNVFTTGKVTMDVVDELGSTNGGVNLEKGCFVMWQMVPDKWQIELVLGGQKVLAGSNGAIAWRHTPWLGVHAAKGRVRPLRRALQASSSSSLSSACHQVTMCCFKFSNRFGVVFVTSPVMLVGIMYALVTP